MRATMSQAASRWCHRGAFGTTTPLDFLFRD
jgi:hypothetical protein